MSRMQLYGGVFAVAWLIGCSATTTGPALSSAQNALQAAAHDPISIASDSDFTGCNCVVSGDGSTANPYVIGPWAINKVTSGVGISIDGTSLTKSFNIVNLTVAGNGSASSVGVRLNHINPSGSPVIVAEITGVQTSITQTGIGVQVENSSYVTVDGMGENPKGAGISASGAGTINKESSGGVDVENSSHVAVKGWQFSASGPSIDPNWVTLDPDINVWSVAGVRFFGVTNSVIDHCAANNVTDVSYTLFNSSHNTVSNNTGDYPYPMNMLLADGSSYNTVTGNVCTTGDFIGLMIADPLPGTATLAQYGSSHDNVVSGNSFSANGPTGKETSPPSVVPAFLGGIVVLNGAYNNTITNNDLWANTGEDLSWAQAVPDSTSAIGVVTFKPVLNCNVTASGGGGGVANLNGNVWTGNTVTPKLMPPCIPAQ